MKYSIKDFFRKCDQIRSFLPIWSHLLKKFLMTNLIFCAALHTELDGFMFKPVSVCNFLVTAVSFS